MEHTAELVQANTEKRKQWGKMSQSEWPAPMQRWKPVQHCYLLENHLNTLCNTMDIDVHTSSGQWIIEETFNSFTRTPISSTNTASIFLSIRPQNIITTYMLRKDKNGWFSCIATLKYFVIVSFKFVILSSLNLLSFRQPLP